MEQMKVVPDFPVKDDAPKPVNTGSGTLYVAVVNQNAPVVAEHVCERPKAYVRFLKNGTEDHSPSTISMKEHEHEEACRRVPHDSLFNCTCGKWWYLCCYHFGGRVYYDHYWREVRWWNIRQHWRIDDIRYYQEAGDE